MTDDAQKMLVHASSAGLTRLDSNDLARRGLRDIEGSEGAEKGKRRKLISEMSPEEMRQALLTSSATGLPNLRAFEEKDTERAAAVVAVSVLDWLECRGHDREELVRTKADALREVQLDAYHDEGRFGRFLFRGDSSQEIKSKLEKARQILRAQTFNLSDQHGGRRVLTGVDFTFGIGKSLPEAEAEERLNRGKAKMHE